MKKIKRLLYLTLQKYAIIPKDRRHGRKLSAKLLLALLYAGIEKIPGVIVECGVAEGESLTALKLLSLAEGKGRPIYGFDTFGGLPRGEQGYEGQFGYSQAEVRQYFKDMDVPMDGITLIEGDIRDTLAHFREPIAFLHVDVDLYEGHNAALEFLWHSVSPGGVVLFDDYGNAWHGAKRAIDEFAAKKHIVLHRAEFADRAYFIKA